MLFSGEIRNYLIGTSKKLRSGCTHARAKTASVAIIPIINTALSVRDDIILHPHKITEKRNMVMLYDTIF